jgi:ribosomal protein S18 acetylase RimI-like enzyme
LSFEIRSYQDADQPGWVRCRALGFLDTAFYDDVRQHKEHYAGPAVELVAVASGEIVGLLDLELEPAPGVLWDTDARGGVIWHVAVHPDYRRRGIGTALVERALQDGREAGLEIVQAWTRDDDWVHAWYESCGFLQRYSYLHVYLQPEEAREEVTLPRRGSGRFSRSRTTPATTPTSCGRVSRGRTTTCCSSASSKRYGYRRVVCSRPRATDQRVTVISPLPSAQATAAACSMLNAKTRAASGGCDAHHASARVFRRSVSGTRTAVP